MKVNEASSKENSKAKQDDSVSKPVTAVESLSFQVTLLQLDFQDLKQGNINRRNGGFMRQKYSKCNFWILKVL